MNLSTSELASLSFNALQDLPEAVFWFDEKGRFFEVNEVACQKWGYTRAEFLTMKIFDVNPNMSPAIWDAHWKAKQEDASTFESSHRRKDGTIFPVDITDIFVSLDGKTYSCAIVRDITERKDADRLARLSDFTIQKAGDAIFWLCPYGFIKNANEVACTRYGYEYADFLKLNIRTLYLEDEKDNFQTMWQQLKKEQQIVFETTHQNAAGRKIQVEVSAHYIQFEDMEYACSMVRDISERKRKEAALRGALLEIKELKEKLEAENNYLQEEIEV
ncbi:MAG: PAS domain S-box protein, partial [Bacteroidota bacterium]